MQIECSRCKKLFYVKPSRPDIKYCSRACRAIFINLFSNCIICDKQIQAFRKGKVKKEKKFCSSLCYGKHLKKIKAPPEGLRWCYLHKEYLPIDFFSKSKRSVCITCAKEYQKKRNQALKQKAVDFLGGKCIRCGYNKCAAALDFHHPDPSLKEKAWTSGKKPWKKVQETLLKEKCILICSNCHREIHFLQRNKNDATNDQLRESAVYHATGDEV